jgi:hypothetical protein
MKQPEEEFNEKLAFLKSYLNRPILSNGSPQNYLASIPREQNPFRDLIFQNQITIMESGIFHKGGLKGKVLPVSGRGAHYKVWPISNLEELLARLTEVVTVSAEPEENVRKYVSRSFDNLLKEFDKLIPIASLGRIRKTTIEKVKNELADWKEKTIKKIPKFKTKIALEIAENLIAHLPSKTPDLTIAERTNELLVAFGKPAMKVRTLTGKIAKLRGNQTQFE